MCVLCVLGGGVRLGGRYICIYICMYTFCVYMQLCIHAQDVCGHMCVSHVCVSHTCVSNICVSHMCVSHVCVSHMCVSHMCVSHVIIYIKDMRTYVCLTHVYTHKCVSHMCVSHVCVSHMCVLHMYTHIIIRCASVSQQTPTARYLPNPR